jgi:hypothetical protein
MIDGVTFKALVMRSDERGFLREIIPDICYDWNATANN